MKIALFVCLLALMTGAGGFSGPSGKVFAVAPTLQIQIEQRAPFFLPRAATAVVGTAIRWENRTGEVHNILADDCLRGGHCSFESRMMRPGENFTVTRLSPGEYAYHCGIHPFMRGFVTVEGRSLPQRPSTEI